MTLPLFVAPGMETVAAPNPLLIFGIAFAGVLFCYYVFDVIARVREDRQPFTIRRSISVIQNDMKNFSDKYPTPIRSIFIFLGRCLKVFAFVIFSPAIILYYFLKYSFGKK